MAVGVCPSWFDICSLVSCGGLGSVGSFLFIGGLPTGVVYPELLSSGSRGLLCKFIGLDVKMGLSFDQLMCGVS
ncbi:MAG: hypothetical protein AAFO91_00895, partial [Bacteroidota bacterium]